MNFDKIYLINLDSAKDRLERVSGELGKLGITFSRVSAVSGDDMSFDVEEESDGWNKNALGLTQTTINILEEAIENDYESIFIFEDDAEFVHDFKYRYEQFINNIPEWEFIQLSSTHITPFEYIGDYKCRITNATCCQAYGIHKSIMKEYLSLLKEFSKPIDEHTSDLHKRGKSYSPLFDIVYHVQGRYSTLREKKVSY